MRIAQALGISAILLMCGVTEPAIAKRSSKSVKATTHSTSVRRGKKRSHVVSPVRSTRSSRASRTRRTTARATSTRSTRAVVSQKRSAVPARTQRTKTEQVIEPPVGVGKDRVEADNVRGVLGKAYRLYDQGLNSRLNGSTTSAVKQLDESRRLFEDARRYQSRGVPSTAEYLVHFEMGRAAEAAGDVSTARDSYARCLKVKPDFINASVRIVTLLARNKQLPLALVWAKQSADRDPSEPRAHTLLALVLRKLGESQKADAEIQKSENLLAGRSGDSRPVEVAVPHLDVVPSRVQEEARVNPFSVSSSPRSQEGDRGDKIKKLASARDKLMSSIAEDGLVIKGIAIGPGTLRVFVDKYEDCEKLPDSVDGVRVECVVVGDK